MLTNESDERVTRGLAGDILALAPGWLICLAVDPTSAALCGLPVVALAVIARRRFFANAPRRGRVAVGSLFPFVALSTAASCGLHSAGAIAPWALALLAVAAIDLVTRSRRRALASGSPVAVGIACAVFAAVFAALLFEGGVFGYPTEDFIKAFAAPPDAPQWSTGHKRVALDVARSAARGEETPSALLLDSREPDAPNGVFVTLYDGAGKRCRGFSRGGVSALADVASAASRARRSAPRGFGARGDDLRVQVDVPGARRAATARPLFSWGGALFLGAERALEKLPHIERWLNLSSQTEIGVDGLAFRVRGVDSPVVVLPGDPIAEGILTPRVTSNPAALAAIARRASKSAFGDPGRIERDLDEISLFRTASFASPRAGETVDLYRGNTLLPESFDRQSLVARAELAVSWLARRVEPSGRFHYEMMPPYRGRTDDYSLPRHAGAVYGLLAAYRFGMHEPALAAAGERALPAALSAFEYTERNLRAPEGAPEGLLCFIDENGGAASGSTALAAISVAELPDPDAVRDPKLAALLRDYPAKERLAGMTRCLLAMIDAEGAVFGTYREAQRRKTVRAEPLYFPGEVALALARIYETTRDGTALLGAQRIADRQLRIYRVPSFLGFPLPGDHWMIQALASLADSTENGAYAELALLMARGYLREQYPPQAFLYPDYRGSYRRIFDVPRTTRAASRGEALGGALRAADHLGADAAPFERALLEGARHLAEQQFTRENGYFVPRSMDVLGGIRMGLVDDHLRIDNNQHGLVAMLNAIRAYDRRQARGGV